MELQQKLGGYLQRGEDIIVITVVAGLIPAIIVAQGANNTDKKLVNFLKNLHLFPRKIPKHF